MADTFTKSGTKASVAAKLPKTVFDLEVTNHELIKSAYVAYMANGRRNNAKTKTRGEVSGGGKKPWRQKGTGRARFGSIRVPIWRGGGITFGPTGQENYSHKITVSSKRLALRQALSLKNKAGDVIVIEGLEAKDGKTKNFNALISKIGINRNAVIVSNDLDANVVRAAKNLPTVELKRVKALNVFDAVNADKVVFVASALDELEEWLTPAKGAAK